MIEVKAKTIRIYNKHSGSYVMRYEKVIVHDQEKYVAILDEEGNLMDCFGAENYEWKIYK